MCNGSENKNPNLVLSENALRILGARYLLRDENGRVIETPEEMFSRVARAVAAAEATYGGNVDAIAEEFYPAMLRLEFLPNSPVLMGAGTGNHQFPACFVLPIGDSMDGIMTTAKNAALIQKEGGGVGFSFGRIRPSGSAVKGTGGVASGPVSFMRMYDAGSEVIKQGGRRRAANMAVLPINHSDIVEFVRSKLDGKGLQAFNISVGVPDDFIRAVEENREFCLVAPHTGQVVGKIRALELLHLMAQCAWETGDPGAVFLDAVNRANPLPGIGRIEATNPCGEQPLLPYESCVLGSVNLLRHLTLDGREINWEKLKRTVWLGVRFLDDCIDASSYPLPIIEATTKSNRKIGLGIMGLAHMLAKLKIPYDSQLGVETAGGVMRFISEEALEASRQLAKTRGPFPNFPRSIYAERGEPAVRNATRTTVAPTGTISIIADTSSGIEPIFAVAYSRKALDGQTFTVMDSVFVEMAKSRGIYNEALAKRVAATGSVQDIAEVPPDLKALFKTACEIAPEWHIRMQSAVQAHTDNAVSKTINLPVTATVEDVDRIFLLAHKLNCKGITVFRQGSRPPVLTTGVQEPSYVTVRERPRVTSGRTVKYRTGCGSMYATLNSDAHGQPLELFYALGKGGGCVALSEAVARLVSLCFRCGVDPKQVVRQLRGIRCATACSAKAAGKPVDVLSCPDGVARTIMEAMGDKEIPMSEQKTQSTCPQCGGPREPGRCGVCLSCYEGGCGEG